MESDWLDMTTVKFPGFSAVHKTEQHCGSYLLQAEVRCLFFLSDIAFISKNQCFAVLCMTSSSMV